MRRYVLAITLALASCQRWTDTDTALHVAVVTSVAIDWHQTMEIVEDCHELNPVIGRCGETVPPNVYFPIVLVTQLAVAYALPKPWRNVFQAFLFGLQMGTIYRNHRNGD